MPVLELAAEEARRADARRSCAAQRGGICGPTRRRSKAALARELGYHAGLLFSALQDADEDALSITAGGRRGDRPFRLLPAAGRRRACAVFVLAAVAEIEGVLAIKTRPSTGIRR